MSKQILNVTLGYVVDIFDETDGDKIKVRIVPYDNRNTDENIPYAYPLLPKFLNVKPKVGETVLVFCSNPKNEFAARYYVGPVISQPQRMGNDQMLGTGLSQYPDSPIQPAIAPSTNSDSFGALAKEDDIAVYGRKKGDIIITDDSVRIRCGNRLNDAETKGGILFNEFDPAYIHLRHTDKKRGDEGKEYRSTATIVADEINLISNKSNEKFKTNNRQHLIRDEEMQTIINKAHQLPYGDVLVEFLQLFVNVFVNHVHDYPGNKPDQSTDVKELMAYKLDNILSKHVKIN